MCVEATGKVNKGTRWAWKVFVAKKGSSQLSGVYYRYTGTEIYNPGEPDKVYFPRDQWLTAKGPGFQAFLDKREARSWARVHTPDYLTLHRVKVREYCRGKLYKYRSALIAQQLYIPKGRSKRNVANRPRTNRAR